ncbi:reverse transcriptase domain-containing protein [Tanacetum coccineum]
MVESSSQNPSSPEITPKEESITRDKPESPNPFLPATHVKFTFEEIAFTTNNEVALLYPSHPNQEYFKFATIGYSGEIGAKGTLKKSCLTPRWRLLMGQIIQCLGGKTGGLDQISNKDAIILYCLANEVQVDYAKLIWEDLIHKLNKKTRKKIVHYPRIISLLLEHMMPEYDNEELTINPTQICLWTSKLKHPPHKLRRFPKAKSLELKVDSEENNLQNIHLSPRLRHPNLKLAIQKKKLCPVRPRTKAQAILHLPHQCFFHLHSKSASGHDASTNFTAEADPGISAPNDFIPLQQGTHKESTADEISKNIKLEDLSDFLKDTRSAFFTPDSPQDKPITHVTSHDIPEDTSVPHPPSPKSAQIQELMAQVQLLQTQKNELEQQKATTEAKVASLKARPSYPDINQITNLLVTSLKPELSKLLAFHNFANCLPTYLKELPLKFTELSREIKELKQHVKDMEIKLPGDLNKIPTKLETFTSTISSLTSQTKLKTLDSLPSILNKVNQTLDRFATVVDNASRTITKDVPSAGQATASPAEGEKNTKDAETNLKDELIDLLGINFMTKYYNKKLLFEKYRDKMLKRKIPKITNCEVLTKKGPITMKVYRENGSQEVISNLKFKDLGMECSIGVGRSGSEGSHEGSSNNDGMMVDTYLQSGMVVGLGSGLASSLAIQYLGQKLQVGLLKDVVGIPTSIGSASEAEKAGIPLQQFQDSSQVCTKSEHPFTWLLAKFWDPFFILRVVHWLLHASPKCTSMLLEAGAKAYLIDFAFNDADIMEEGSLTAVIGRQIRQGEVSLLEEKRILDVTKNLVLMVTEKHYKSAVEGSIPVLVKSVSWMDTAEEIDDLFVGDAEVWRRPSVGHADPTGGNFPLVTRGGHNFLDVIFTSPIENLAEVAKLLDGIEGVAAHGIIANTPCTAVIATESGIRIIENTVNSDMRSI